MTQESLVRSELPVSAVCPRAREPENNFYKRPGNVSTDL